ncbi:diguanylate cyclase [Massilia sp. CMS3.1]|uniref:diguanylate cyclase n=1 Tax=Massilia sp. CMS3.1 TaxID=3373083 RepID=UPI003EE4C010
MISITETTPTLAPAALNLLECGVIVLDAQHRIVLWNRWMVSRSGRSAARVREHTLFDVFPDLRGSRVEAAVLAALGDGTSSKVPAAQGGAPFPLREAGSFDGPRIDQAIAVTGFREGKAAFCMIEIRDVSGFVDRERHLLEHAESLRARSYVDGLTGIHNRGYFDLSLERELRRVQRHGGALSLLLMDIDSFKAYNDHFGHQAGDACLITVAQAVAVMLKRPADVAARYGGEEFAAILPDTSAEQALSHANAIRARIAALALPHAPAALKPHVTLSIGVATFGTGRLDGAASLIAAADKALYAAKRRGRDRVVMASEAGND